MTRLIEEQISAFLDGELSAEEAELLVRRLENEDDHRFTLARYGLIGECVRGANSEFALGLHRRVGEQLADDVTPIQEAVSRRWAIPAGVAASLVLAATALLINWPGNETGVSPSPVSVPQTVATTDESTTEFVATVSGTGAGADTSQGSEPIIEPARLTQYLVSHGGHSGSFSRQVMDSRIVGQPASGGRTGFQRAGWRDDK